MDDGARRKMWIAIWKEIAVRWRVVGILYVAIIMLLILRGYDWYSAGKTVLGSIAAVTAGVTITVCVKAFGESCHAWRVVKDLEDWKDGTDRSGTSEARSD